MLPKHQSTSGAERGGREPANVSQGWAQPCFGALGSSTRAGRIGSLVAVIWAVGCGSEAALLSPGATVEDAGGKVTAEPDDDETTGSKPNGGKPAAGSVEAPGITASVYPRAPYGTTEGSIIADLELFGWKDPSAAQFDVARGATVRLSDFYNADSPAGEGIELIMLSAVAAWCSVCRTEYQHMKDNQTYAQLAPRGLEMVGVLFEDNNGDPPTFADLTNWSRSYSVAFPFVNDPSFKTGVYFDKSATPMNMIIDARTMQILLVMTGYNPLIYDEIDKLLTERGR